MFLRVIDTARARISSPARVPPLCARARSSFAKAGILAAVVVLALAGCAPPPASVSKDSLPLSGFERGGVSHYGHALAGRKTASGEPFDPEAMTMAHRTLPFGTRVKVTNLENRQSVEVVVNDRGPFVRGRIADLSLGAARRIGMVDDGVVDGVLEISAPAKGR